MAKHTDILLNDNYEIIIENGDVKVGPSEGQEAKLLMMYNEGSLRSSPLTGVGLTGYINAEADASALKRLDKIIHQQFEMDDKTIDTISYVTDSGNLLDVSIDFEQN